MGDVRCNRAQRAGDESDAVGEREGGPGRVIEFGGCDVASLSLTKQGKYLPGALHEKSCMVPPSHRATGAGQTDSQAARPQDVMDGKLVGRTFLLSVAAKTGRWPLASLGVSWERLAKSIPSAIRAASCTSRQRHSLFTDARIAPIAPRHTQLPSTCILSLIGPASVRTVYLCPTGSRWVFVIAGCALGIASKARRREDDAVWALAAATAGHGPRMPCVPCTAAAHAADHPARAMDLLRVLGGTSPTSLHAVLCSAGSANINSRSRFRWPDVLHVCSAPVPSGHPRRAIFTTGYRSTTANEQHLRGAFTDIRCSGMLT
ncbi:hypothetical protein Purlil1_12667 [Purpureocillium lilacinum]|uniref:Uncharacterized protein n=1 Tax=Purpureocillium lilacinum TaxID=33203 RepID=A0ABR0BGE9_PURLI|nr:hypothetical protein Purlil1_12667 [Purpureocillium lilacinum]